MSAKYTIGPDVDLDVDVVLDKGGRRITERRAEEIAADALRKAGVGRPSLTAPGQRSPEIIARVPSELRDRLREAAQRRGVSASELVREASTSTWLHSRRTTWRWPPVYRMTSPHYN